MGLKIPWDAVQILFHKLVLEMLIYDPTVMQLLTKLEVHGKNRN